MFLTLLNIVVPVFSIASLGFFVGRHKKSAINMDFINHVNIHIFCPALIISALVNNPVTLSSSWVLLLAGLVVILLPGLLLLPFQPQGISLKAFVVSGMFRNTGNMGIPLMMLAYGREYMGDIVLLFVLSNALHFSVGLFLLADKQDRWQWLKNPNIWATLLGLLGAPYSTYFPGFVMITIDMLGQITIPLMLFSLGVRIAQDKLSQVGLALRINLLFLLSGAIAALLVILLFPLSQSWTRMLVLAAMLPPAVLNFLLCDHYKASPYIVANVVLMGNVLSIITIPITIALTLILI